MLRSMHVTQVYKLYIFILLSFSFITIQCIYPFDPISFNLIDVTPNCYPMGLCTEYGEWGQSIHSVHPSSEERTLHLLRNVARLFPTEYRYFCGFAVFPLIISKLSATNQPPISLFTQSIQIWST